MRMGFQKMLEVELLEKGSSHQIWKVEPDVRKYAMAECGGLESHLTRVLLADDHPRVRKGMRNILQRCPDIEVIGEASNGLQALEMVEELAPDILLLDMEMPVMNGSQVAARLHQMNSPVQILVLSAHDDQQYIQCMLDAGASGYIIKEDVPEILIDAVKGVARGEKGWISQRVAAKIDNKRN
jgi:DNA-binding NarL/FixJ family response regulator